MGYTSDDATYEAHMAEEAERHLQEAIDVAEDEVRRFGDSQRSDRLHPAATFELATSGDDQPLFRFKVLVDVPANVDPAEWPGDEVERLTSELRRVLEDTPVDDFEWYVTAGSRHSQAA